MLLDSPYILLFCLVRNRRAPVAEAAVQPETAASRASAPPPKKPKRAPKQPAPSIHIIIFL